MSWLKINGIEMARLMALAGDPSGTRRDIGSKGEAASGAMVVTRQTSKRDLKLTTKPLTGAQAFSVEGLLMGDANVWPFDSSFYSSKGIAGLGSHVSVVLQSTQKVYGAQALLVPDTRTWSTVGLGLAAPYTVAFWSRRVGWQHVVWRSDGTVWINGVVTAFTITDLVVLTAGELVFGGYGADYYVDDLVVSPFLWLDNWPAQVFAAAAPFGQAPFLTASGDLVREAATRRMVGVDVSEKIIIAGLEGAQQRDARVLSVELKGV